MMNKQKHVICTVLLAMKDNHVTLPERAAVLAIKSEKHNFKSALEALKPDDITPADLAAVNESIREWSATLRDYNDDSFRRKFLDILSLYSEIPLGATFTSKIKADQVPPAPPAPKPATITTPQLLRSLNALLKLQGKPAIKTWKASRAKLEERIDTTRAAIENAKPTPKKAETVVAEGAYKTEEEAFARTGHRTKGKTKKMLKDEKRKERFIEKRIGTSSSHHLKASELRRTTETKTKPKGDHITLADVARELNMIPKVARAKARRHIKELSKLEIEGKKYRYAPASMDAVKKILQADDRKK